MTQWSKEWTKGGCYGKSEKDCHPFSIRMDKEAYEKLLAMCEDSGMSKTIAIERTVIQFADEYFENKKRLSELKDE